MTRNRAFGVAASAALLLALFVVLPGVGADDKDKEKREGLYRPLGLFTEVLSLVKANYVEPVETKPLLAGAFAGMTEAMDPFSEYIPPDRMEAFTAFQAAKQKDFPELGLVLAKRFGYPVIVAPIAGSPAAAAGLKSDDLIEKIDGQHAHGLALWEVEAKLAGKPGRRVSLLVVRDGKPRRRTLEIVAGSWTPKPPSAARVQGETVVTIPSFAPGTAKEVAALLAPFDRTKPLVLDLRENAWGSYDEAARTAALFVPAGPLGELSGRKIETKLFRSEAGERVHDGRLVLLVDSGTAGPAEFFAAAVREALDKTPPKAAEKRAKFERTLTGRSSGSTKRRRRQARGRRPSPGTESSCGSSASRAWGWRSPSRSSGCRAAARCRSRSGRSGRSPAGPSRRRGSRPTTASTTSRRTKRSTSPPSIPSSSAP